MPMGSTRGVYVITIVTMQLSPMLGAIVSCKCQHCGACQFYCIICVCLPSAYHLKTFHGKQLLLWLQLFESIDCSCCCCSSLNRSTVPGQLSFALKNSTKARCDCSQTPASNPQPFDVYLRSRVLMKGTCSCVVIVGLHSICQIDMFLQQLSRNAMTLQHKLTIYEAFFRGSTVIAADGIVVIRMHKFSQHL